MKALRKVFLSYYQLIDCMFDIKIFVCYECFDNGCINNFKSNQLSTKEPQNTYNESGQNVQNQLENLEGQNSIEEYKNRVVSCH